MEQNSFIDAAVERIDARTVRICWEAAGNTTVHIYRGLTPGDIDRKMPVAVSDQGCVEISGLDQGTRHYFELSANGDRMLVAERRIRLDGAVNFRDLGGYRTEDGRRVRWGQVFRADGLSRLSDDDHLLLGRIGIRRVFDFRTAGEIEEAPDRLPADGSLAYVHLPVIHGRFDFVEAVRRLKMGDTSWLTPDFMVNGYINNIESFSGSWGEVIRHLIETEAEPLVFHCTGGKDRTGTCAALILLALGIPEETVIDDHQLSNIYIAELLPALNKMMSGYGIDPQKLFPYLTAPRDCIVTLLDYIREKYGSAAGYLTRRTPLTAEGLERMRDRLLI